MFTDLAEPVLFNLCEEGKEEEEEKEAQEHPEEEKERKF